MPELPEVEAARALAERWTLGRAIVDVDDADEWVCRPHPPGEIAAALIGRRIVGVGRIGKSLWLDLDDERQVGLHLGMAGRLVGMAPEGAGSVGSPGGVRDGTAPTTTGVARLRADHAAALGLPDTAGEPLTARERTDWSMPVRNGSGAGSRELPGEPSWTRFAIDVDDGGRLLLFDKRRLGRVRLDPDLSHLGPDALLITADEFVERVGRGTTPLKARLMDQATIAGIGNLLCDEVLWQAEQPPLRPAADLSADELQELHATVQAATREAIVRGGVHLGDVIPHRRKGEHCPRCGAEMVRATVGGRTTWWCSFEQAWPPDDE
ncbi:MAG: Fpg/Nei family DNA glycosylase [Solirubrobacteraceae bacterium]